MGIRIALDLGVSSIGWAVLELRQPANDGEVPMPARVIRAGVHHFDAGDESSFLVGKDESPAKPRREARLARRMIWRRARRKRKLLKLLQRVDLLPAGDISTPERIDQFIKSLDEKLREKWERGATHREAQLLPYRLRAAALDRPLERHELGRALYHLAQRRGFLSNRRTLRKKDEDLGDVKRGISELEEEIHRSGTRTLGEYFASIDPQEVRLRRRFTSRAMYVEEFEAIWRAQAPHLGLSDTVRVEIRDAIFHQRPLKSQQHLVGRCRYLWHKRRAPLACRLAQRFRALQKLNDLMVVDDAGEKIALTPEQREVVLHALQSAGSVRFSELRKRPIFGKETKFNLEHDGERSLVGFVTDARLRDALGDAFDAFPEQVRDRIVDELCADIDDHELRSRLARIDGLAPAQVDALVQVQLEDGYAMLSRAAMRRLLPLMEQGVPYMTAVDRVFPHHNRASEPLAALPPVHEQFRDLRNPTVQRGLSELRKLVNLIIKRYGKPDSVSIELLRELKKSRKLRQRIAQEQLERRREREGAIARIREHAGIQQPRSSDIEKVLLADECCWRCPYTGRNFGWTDLLGPEPTVEVEHIWPFSRSLDNSFANKTLCYIEENRKKGNRAPAEFYSEAQLDEIVRRVRRFNSRLADVKAERFKAVEIPADFTERHLRESSYFARLASEYLGLLFGGVVDAAGRRRVFVVSGELTAWLRQEWRLESLQTDFRETDEPGKNRGDLRHHAIDAIVVGFATPRVVKMLTEAALRARELGRRRFAALELPWPSFVQDVQRAIDAIIVSNQQGRRVAGALHAETLYSRPIRGRDGKERRHVRWPWSKFTSREQLDLIVDPRLRACAIEQFERSGKKKPADAFKDHPPVWRMRDGRTLPIRGVRVVQAVNPRTIGKGATQRFVESTHGSNHHVRILAKLRPDGTEETWVGEVFTRFDVLERRRQHLPDVDREAPPGYAFKFSLAANEYVEIDDPDAPPGVEKRRAVYRVANISSDNFGRVKIMLVEHNDGRTRDERKRTKDDWSPGPGALFKLRARKVFVNYLGEVKGAGG